MVLIRTKLFKLLRVLCSREMTLHTSGYASNRLSFSGMCYLGLEELWE